MTESVAQLDITGLDQREAWLAGEIPPPQQIRPGTWSLPVVFPDNPLRYTLCYLLEDSAGPVLVDPGCFSDVGPGRLAEVVAAAGFSLADIAGVVVTHAHMDHHGLSRVVLEASGCWMGMHPEESRYLVARIADPEIDGADDQAWLLRCGVPADVRAELHIRGHIVENFRRLAQPTVALSDGDLLPMTDRRVRVVWTPGHTPGHICLHDETEDLFFSGDHVLPRISPHIGSQPRKAPTPLGPYLSSLAATARFDSAEVLPGHEWRFRGLGTRVEQLLEHHEHRCQEILDALARAGSASPWELTTQLSWSRGWPAIKGFNRRAALAETMAHLDYLLENGRVGERVEHGLAQYHPSA